MSEESSVSSCEPVDRLDDPASGARYCRILNEVPTVLMIGIGILIVVKPF